MGCSVPDLTAVERATFPAAALGLPRGNGFRHPLHPYDLVSPSG